MTTILALTTEQVARLTGLSIRQLRYWDSTDFSRPSLQDEKGKPYGRIYSFRDVVALRVLAMLRNEHRASLQELRKVGEWLACHPENSWTMSKFYVAGRRVYFYNPRSNSFHQGSRPQQTVTPIEVQEVVTDTERRARLLQERGEEEIGKIIQHRYISHNEPVLAGTRIRSSAIWRFHRAGYSTEEILKEYPRLTEKDIEAAIAFESRQRQAVA